MTTTLRRREDHDLIVGLNIKMEAIREDIKDLKDGTTAKIADHEMRIRAGEGRLANYAGGFLVLQFITGIILWYFSRK